VFLRSAHPLRASKRGRRRRPQVVACYQSAGRFHLFPALSLAEIGEGGTVISSLIEDWRRLANNFLPGLLAFAHVGTPDNRIQSLTALCPNWMGPSGLTLHQTHASPPRLRIENASDLFFTFHTLARPEAFPIKASDHLLRTHLFSVPYREVG
jgi:hypothetical protein